MRDVRRGRYHSGASGCGAGNCATAGDCVAAYYDGDYGYETFGGGDYGIAGYEDERYYDYGGGVDSGECEKRESGSVGFWSWRTTDPAVRKFQEKDPEFPKYDGNPEQFLACFVAVEESKEPRQLSNQAAIIFATEALEGHVRGTAGYGKKFENWLEFAAG